MRKRGAEESLSFLMGVVVAIIIAIPMFILIWNYVEAQNMSEKNFEELVKVVKEMKVGEERDFGIFINDKYYLVSLNKEQLGLNPNLNVILNQEGREVCESKNCLFLFKLLGWGEWDIKDYESFDDTKFVGERYDNQVYISGKQMVTLHIEKKEIGGEVVVGICLEKPCIK